MFEAPPSVTRISGSHSEVQIPIVMSSESKEMPSVKRHHDGAEKKKKEVDVKVSPFMPMFEKFRDELDEHHDRRERIIKTSRDVTAASKKM